MSKAASTKSVKGKDAGGVERRQHDLPSRPAISGSQGQVLNLQRTIGNRAISKLLQSRAGSSRQQPNQRGSRPTTGPASGSEQPKSDSHATLLLGANADSAGPLDENVRTPLEQNLGVNLGGVRVHAGRSSEAAAESLGARAYTIGSDIYLGPAARRLNATERNRLLAHEAVHTVQQGGQPVALQGKLEVSHPGDHAEIEADQVAETVLSHPARNPSAALALRDSMRISPIAPSIQRDIKDVKEWPNGKLKINFTKHDAAAAGGEASEDGEIRFTPSNTAPESDSIRLIQVVRMVNTATGAEWNFTGKEKVRNQLRTTGDPAANVTPGFMVDQYYGNPRNPRANKADADILPYYDVTSPGTIGSRRGATIVPATLHDTPSFTRPLKYNFVTSAKAQDTGFYYGTVLWGFEVFLDAAGIAKVKGEYHSFRSYQGETTDAALKVFGEHFRSKGSATAPTT